MSSDVFWMLEMTIRPGQLDALKALMPEMVEATQANEPGTLNYEWFISADETQCHIYERYADSDAVMTHLGNFGANFAERFMACFEPTSFSVYGPASTDVRDALAAFGAVHLDAMDGFRR